MNRAWVYGVSIAACLLMVAGCSKKKLPPPPDVQSDQVVGTWTEIKTDKAANNPRMANIERPTDDLRQITINQDGTWELKLVEPGGGSASSKTMKGSWTAEGPIVIFEMTENNLGSKYEGWAPLEYSGIYEGQLMLMHQNGESVRYDRAA